MYEVKLRDQAERDFAHLPPKHAGQVRRKIDSLAATPRPHDCKRVISLPGYLRVGAGEYRIIYSVDDQAQVAVIARIRHRREAYR